MIMQKGQDEVLGKEAMEFCVLLREQLGNVLATSPPVNVRGSQSRPALKLLPDLFNAKVLLDNFQASLAAQKALVSSREGQELRSKSRSP